MKSDNSMFALNGSNLTITSKTDNLRDNRPNKVTPNVCRTLASLSISHTWYETNPGPLCNIDGPCSSRLFRHTTHISPCADKPRFLVKPLKFLSTSDSKSDSYSPTRYHILPLQSRSLPCDPSHSQQSSDV